MSKNRYGLPEGMPFDKYGHAIGADTDPYSILIMAVGSPDDFVCFDYGYFHWKGVEYCALHATHDSESADFIEDFSYKVLPLVDRCAIINPELIRSAHAMVESALACLEFCHITHDSVGWNQDPHYLTRLLAVETQLHANLDPAGEAYELLTAHQKELRHGGERIHRMVNMVADAALFPAAP